ncbi:alpha/beta fold hydrolase [Actinophytocola sp.]|uniref:alpha/beta fold hydrolase n=1 Tax=Actinophytocola sp. TaxID=1872138 RepID=UPI00389A2513
MHDTKTGTLPVPGASLYYEVRGSGPLLLIAQGGDGNAARGADLADRLAADHTVVTYDRRGLSHSTLDDPTTPVTVATHADDAHRLLAALTDEPAYVFGSSFGALLGLTLAAAHPDQVHTLVAHDPATFRLLAPEGRDRATRDLDILEDLFRDQGTLPALAKLSELVEADFSDREPDVPMPTPPGPERLADLEFFFRNDLPQLRAAELDAGHIATLTSRVVPAAGQKSRRLWNYDCAQALASLLDTDVTEFPGGHSLSTHPAAFTTRLREVLNPRSS